MPTTRGHGARGEGGTIAGASFQRAFSQLEQRFPKLRPHFLQPPAASLLRSPAESVGLRSPSPKREHQLTRGTSWWRSRLHLAHGLPSPLSFVADGTIVVVVEDDGPGVPERLREKVLMPFFTTKAVGVGTGLGLAVVQKIAAEHSGRLAVTRSTALGGARFELHVPPPSSAIKRHKRGKRNLMRSVGSERASRSDDATGASFGRVATIARA